MHTIQLTDGFEIDMTAIFENARQYYEIGSRYYVDAEILQEVSKVVLLLIHDSPHLILTLSSPYPHLILTESSPNPQLILVILT